MQHISFTFSGRGTLIEEQNDFPDKAFRIEVIPSLNRRRERIAYEIAQGVSAQLPPGCRVNVDITFHHGSVLWDGIVGVITTMGIIGGAAEFAEYVARGIRLAVTSVVRDHIDHSAPHPMPDMRMETDVVVALPPTTQATDLTIQNSQAGAFGTRPMKVALSLLLINAILLLWVLIFLYVKLP